MNNLENGSRFDNPFRTNVSPAFWTTDFTLPSSRVMCWARISQG